MIMFNKPGYFFNSLYYVFRLKRLDDDYKGGFDLLTRLK